MSTSLAEQLQRLAVPQTNLLTENKKYPSLLFSTKDAASLKRETVYHIGLEGLEELILKNDIFKQFLDTLFHTTSKSYERSVQNHDANRILNKDIKKFLLLLSPYFLLNCTSKALEWLINRYQIHEYNRDELLMLALPYHESNLFVKIIQLMKFKEQNDLWMFLKALRKPGLHLTKKSLLNHAATNVGFLKFVTRFIMQLIDAHPKHNLLTVAFNFYSTVFCGAIEYSEQLQESQITQMLPLLLKGISSDITDFCAASYVIIARLVGKTTLSNKLLTKIVNKVSHVPTSNLRTEALLVLLVIYQSQKEFVEIPVDAVSCLRNEGWLIQSLHKLNTAGCYIYPFLGVLLKTLTKDAVANDVHVSRIFVKNVLDSLQLADSFAMEFMCCVLDILNPKFKYSTDIKNWIFELIHTLEIQYPKAFDQQVYAILSTPKLHKKKKVLGKILKGSINQNGKIAFLEMLYHPQTELRTEALKNALDNFSSLRDSDKELIKSALLDRLDDDNPSTIFDTLTLVVKSEILDENVLNDILMKICKKCIVNQNPEWTDLSKIVIDKLCTSFSWHKFFAVFPYLLPNNNEQLSIAKSIIKSTLITSHPILCHYQDKLLDIDNQNVFTKLILKWLKSNKNLDILNNVLDILKPISYKFDCIDKYSSCVILTCISPKNCDVATTNLIVNVLIKYIETSKNKYIQVKPTKSHYMQIAAINNKLPVIGILQCITTLVHKRRMLINLRNIDRIDFSLESNLFLVQITSVFMKYLNVYKGGIERVLNYFCKNVQEKISFLLNLGLTEQALCEQFRINSLKFISDMILNTKKTNTDPLTSINSIVSVLLLTWLYDDNKDIRLAVFKIFDFLTNTSKKESYVDLLELILKHKDEITMDHHQVPIILANILLPTDKKSSNNLGRIGTILVKHTSDLNTPSYITLALLNILSQINSLEVVNQLCLVPISILKEATGDIPFYKSHIIIKNMDKLVPELVERVSLNSNVWMFIEQSLTSEHSLQINEHSKMSVAVSILKHLNKEVMAAFDNNILKKLLDTVCTIVTISKDPEVLDAASKIFKHIDLDCSLILDILIKMRDVQSPKCDLTKRRRVSVIPTIDILDTLEWKKGTTMLEFIQEKKKLRNAEELLQLLFEILKKCLDFDEQAIVEYFKQLILSLILHCCSKIDHEKLPETIFNIEIIVQCIRASQNPQTHYQALLVLANTGHLVPRQVLHHIMAIFTFMGSSVLRYDDAYSFQIISKIIDTIIPILMKDGDINTTAKVLRVFVDALLDVPEHRKIFLYSQLLNRIGTKENLYLFLLLVFEAHVLHSSKDKQRTVKEADNKSKRLDIATDLCHEYSPDTVLTTCIHLLKYLIKLPQEKEDNMVTEDECPTFNIDKNTPKQFRHYKYTLLVFIANFLSSTKFVNKVALLEDDKSLELEVLFKDIIINILTYIQRTSKVLEAAASSPQAQYWKVILHYSYDILDSINALITPQMFLLVIKGLMLHNLSAVKRRALELLNTKLQSNMNFFKSCDKNDTYSLLPPIIGIVEGILHEEPQNDQEVVIQTALLSLKLLIRALASEDPEKFVQVLEFMTILLKSGKANNNILASVILCLAELCVDLKAHAISCLPAFMPPFIKILKQQKHQNNSNLLLLSVVTTVQKLCDSLPLFLSPYLDKLLYEMSILMSKWDPETIDNKLQPLSHKLANIKQRLGSVIPSRILIPAITETYTHLKEKKLFFGIRALMEILREHLTNMKGNDVTVVLPELTNFFIKALQFRCEENISLAEVNDIEAHIIDSFSVLILKLSENSFRPLYFKLYDWAVRNEQKSERVITYYNISNKIAESLKGLFVIFAGHFINHAAQTLDNVNQVKSEKLYFDNDCKNILLLENILKTLNATFKYENYKFVNKERFEILMQPLVDQLENSIGDLKERNQKILTPCLVNFALAVADDALWKQMNYQILLKMRHSSTDVRLIALHCLTEIVKKLGEDFLPLLPETIPFLAELLEDEDEKVEKACQSAVQEMEKVLGESLQKYF